MLEGYLGKGDTFDQAIGVFSMAYLERNKEDYEALKSAVSEGRISVAQ